MTLVQRYNAKLDEFALTDTWQDNGTEIDDARAPESATCADDILDVMYHRNAIAYGIAVTILALLEKEEG